MRLPLGTSIVLSCCAALGACDPSPIGPDAATADADTSTRCLQLSEEWETFLDVNAACASDDECVLYGVEETCNCAGYYSGPSGPAFNRRALAEAADRFPTAATVGCGPVVEARWVGKGLCDAWWTVAICREGRCRAAVPREVGQPEQRCGM
ncbi:MAG: hypothetical protein H6719_21230 [Sandaracinaceae bacterium]|nr:hypothetical protein [Sandaracinaceae bacterium]